MFKHRNSTFNDHVLEMSNTEIETTFKGKGIDIEGLKKTIADVKKERKDKADAEAKLKAKTDTKPAKPAADGTGK